MSEKKKYEFTVAGWFMGDFYKVGATIRLFPEQVKYEGHRLQEVKLDAATSPDSAPEKPKKGRKA